MTKNVNICLCSPLKNLARKGLNISPHFLFQMKRMINFHAGNTKLVKAILCAGLYPNVAKISVLGKHGWVLYILKISWAPFHLRFFRRISNSMEISFHFHLQSNRVIAIKFCTWHDSCAVVACAKIYRDLMASNGITARRSFHRIWIAGKKSLVKRAPSWFYL